VAAHPISPLPPGHVLKINFATFTPRVTIRSESEPTVEIIADGNLGFSDTVEYGAVAVRDDVAVLTGVAWPSLTQAGGPSVHRTCPPDQCDPRPSEATSQPGPSPGRSLGTAFRSAARPCAHGDGGAAGDGQAGTVQPGPAALGESMAQALRERGVPPLVADLAAEVGARAFYGALEGWASSADQRTLTEHAREIFGELKAAISVLE
jgi:hypothetical protein